MQINLNHVQRDTSNRWLLSDVLDAIQHQMPGAWNASARVAGGLSQWLDEQELETLLSAHSNELETKKKQVEYEQLTKNKQAAQVLYAYDKANPNTKWAVGTTTLDFERLTLSSQQFKDWVSKLLKNDTVSFLQREDLHAASYYLALAKAQTIIITNGI